MPTLAEELALDLAAAVAPYEQSFEWRGRNYPCVRNPEPMASEPGDGGEIESLPERILVARAVFPAGEPQIGDAIDGGKKQIKLIEPNLAQLILHVDSFDK